MSKPAKDLTGQRFGRLLVLERAGTYETPNGSKKPLWLCRCDCGNTAKVVTQGLTTGTTNSCGCYQKEATGNRARVHGRTHTPTHQTWRGMRERCTNPNSNHYHLYGAKGVGFCERWDKFENFLEDMGERPEGTSLDRYPDPKGNYEPGNCRWATPAEQSRNTERTVMITWDGVTLCRKDWAERLGITTVALKVRLKKWGLERAMTTPRFESGRKQS